MTFCNHKTTQKLLMHFYCSISPFSLELKNRTNWNLCEYYFEKIAHVNPQRYGKGQKNVSNFNLPMKKFMALGLYQKVKQKIFLFSRFCCF